MKRRNPQRTSFINLLLESPWWVSAIAAAGVYGASHWILPALAADHSILRPLTLGLRPFGLILAVLFCYIAMLLAIKQVLTASTRPSSTTSQPSVPAAASTVTRVATDRVAKAWEAMAADSTPAHPSSPDPAKWSIALLRAIEWKRFEELMAAFYRAKNFRTETLRAGADGGVDIKLFLKDQEVPIAIVQCKAWNAYRVGVKPVRELLGVMAHQKVARGIFVATGEYTREAVAFAQESPLQLLTGEMVMRDILALPETIRQELLAVATEGDFMTPTCPSCGTKMKRRESARGAFWGCQSYPRCKQKFVLKANVS